MLSHLPLIPTQTSVPHAGTASPGGVAEEGEEEGDHVEDSAGTSSTDEDREV